MARTTRDLDLHGCRAVVMGLGRFGGGVAAARFLSRAGASVLVTDRQDASALAESVEELRRWPVRFRLGEHRREDFAGADLVVASPAVPPAGNPFLETAAEHGARVTTEIALGLERLPSRRTMAVTGTVGKSTVAAMIAHGMTRLGDAPAHLVGNIGASLLAALDGIDPEDWVVVELSSFMLEWLADHPFSPQVAVMTPFHPHHLERHGTVEAYRAAKARLFRGQRAGDRAVFAAEAAERFPTEAGVERREVSEPASASLAVAGEHNRRNAALAAEAAAAALGIERSEAEAALRSFRGLAHRLEGVGRFAGVSYVNDAKATTPEAAERALEALAPGPLRAILGGAERGQQLGRLARAAAKRCRGIYTVGETGDRIADAAEAAGERAGAVVRRCGTVEAAVRAAAADATEGETVILTPGCASSDQFPNYEHRGAAFVDAVRRIAGGGDAT